MLTVRRVTKRYGPLVALDDFTADFHPGEVHAVVGENGAGKSTLVSIVSGFVSPTGGSLALEGEPLPLGRPFASRRRGVEMIHQHFALVPEFTAEENMGLARLPGLGRRLNAKQLAAPSVAAADRLGWAIDPGARARNLPVGSQQRLEILKALGGDARVIVFDEPTAVLAPDEVADLLRVLRQLAEQGKIVILIAHKLSEVMAVADRVTVLRKGKTVATAARGEFDEARLAEWMVGEIPHASVRLDRAVGEPRLTAVDLHVRGDRGETAVRGVELTVAGGEILGIGGVDGNGQLELAEALAGIRPIAQGYLNTGGRIAGYIPQDRQRDGLALTMSVQDNLLVTGHRRPENRVGFFLRMKVVRRWCRSLIERFAIKVENPRDPINALSGGNQQKVVVSRTLDADPEVLIVAGPTRGLDVKAAQFVHEQLRAARNAGAAIVLFSADLDELVALADRTLFMTGGRLVSADDAVGLLGGTSA